MALYNYTCTSCDATFELSKKISERDNVGLDACPECATIGQIVRQVGSPMIGYSVTVPGGYGKPPEGFREVLRRIHSRSPGSQMDKTASWLT